MNLDHAATLLKDSAKAGVCHVPQRDVSRLLTAASAAGLVVRRADLKGVRGKEALFDRLSSALSFPEWFGRNWDALADCLSDLSWLPASGYVLALDNVEELPTRQRDDFNIAIQVCSAAADLWHEKGVPFWVLLDARTKDVPAFTDIK
jgi:RNAse (barnase) inhibitor barstar